MALLPSTRHLALGFGLAATALCLFVALLHPFPQNMTYFDYPVLPGPFRRTTALTPLDRCRANPFSSPGYLTSSEIDLTLNRWNPFQEDCTTPSLTSIVAAREPLPWLMHRTVVIAGVSVDRNHAHEFCEIVHGKWEAIRWGDPRSAKWDEDLMGDVPEWTKETIGFDFNLPHLCTIEEYDFILVQSFHFGLANPETDHWKTVHPSGDGEYRPGYFAPPIFEDRITAHLLPLLDNLGPGRREPDLIEVSASEWDIYYWVSLPEYHHAPFYGNNSLIYLTDLTKHVPHYITRMRSVATFLLTLFPTTRPLLWRVPVELPQRGWPTAQLANVVDQATRSVFLESEEWGGLVELDETGAMLRGSGETSWYASGSHPAKIPHAYVWSDFILWRLQGVAGGR